MIEEEKSDYWQEFPIDSDIDDEPGIDESFRNNFVKDNYIKKLGPQDLSNKADKSIGSNS